MDDRFPLAASREPNPLRPYHIPPSIGHQPSRPQRELLPELDLNFTSSAAEAWRGSRSLIDNLFYRYTSVLLAQPLDVARIILQVSLPPELTAARTPFERPLRPSAIPTADDSNSDSDSDSESDSSVVAYFASQSRSRSPKKRETLSKTPTPRLSSPASAPREEHTLQLRKADSISQVLSQLYQTSGAIGLWRASNTTFIYTTLSRMTESFLRGFLYAVMSITDIMPSPAALLASDPSGLASGFTGGLLSGADFSASANPMGHLAVLALATGITGVLLSPLDLIRTRLVVTPLSHPPRGLVANIRRLPSLLPSPSLYIPTILAHTLPPLFSACVPLFLTRKFSFKPSTSTLALLMGCANLMVRLPLETILRRAHIAEIKRSEPLVKTIIPPGGYGGVFPTIGTVCREGTRPNGRKGQGVAGLYRGWKVGFWGLMGVWMIGWGASGAGGEF
ncbi:hypothetical protein K470DRAFT_233365 [Piedraia hortae CBS 480.64]|uniref:Mitochondrial carrier n=1 Tax=Piedraia hortae CBS 480.64 TaxID=1314780 RepID=A0A6A7BZ83_9PEZI|nr:hypothetical protein K470DRAFT_233365 [Piedraia hortae CBS 480.64]